MKIVNWNCQGAFRKKAAVILKEKPDILIIQECEHPDKLIFSKELPKPTQVLWFGTNNNKGLCVFSYSHYSLKIIDNYNPAFKLIIPIKVSYLDFECILFAIWANNPEDKKHQYIGQIWKAFHFYSKIFTHDKMILVGDFNSNSIWDKKYNHGNHTDLVLALQEKNVESIYHITYNEKQGEETQPTFYLYRNENKPYHLDYCFASQYFIKRIKHFEVGSYKDWTLYSDHNPIFIEFNLIDNN